MKISANNFNESNGVKSVPSGPVQRLLSMIERDREGLEKNKILIKK